MSKEIHIGDARNNNNIKLLLSFYEQYLKPSQIIYGNYDITLNCSCFSPFFLFEIVNKQPDGQHSRSIRNKTTVKPKVQWKTGYEGHKYLRIYLDKAG